MTNKDKFKICNKCGTENPLNADKCSNCKSNKFAPGYILKSSPITRQTFVQVTKSQKGDNRITLYKWWPGGKSSFNINNLEQWEKIRDIIESRMLQFLGWKTKDKIVEKIKQFDEVDKDEETQKYIEELTKNYPDFVRKILSDIDFENIDSSNYQEFADIVNELSEIISKTDKGFRYAFRNVIKQLPKQQKRAVEDLDNLLKTWSLKQITTISTQVVQRLQTLELFKERVLDDKTYEIRGENSIHRILEKAMWIIDERYWLMHSNETLRKIVTKELSEKYKKFEKKRPDFVCGEVGNKLIIIELKRPSHELKTEDLNQLETYLKIIENHTTVKRFEAYLVGRKISDDLIKTMKYRGNQFKILTFTDMIADTEKRYKEFIEALNTK